MTYALVFIWGVGVGVLFMYAYVVARVFFIRKEYKDLFIAQQTNIDQQQATIRQLETVVDKQTAQINELLGDKQTLFYDQQLVINDQQQQIDELLSKDGASSDLNV